MSEKGGCWSFVPGSEARARRGFLAALVGAVAGIAADPAGAFVVREMGVDASDAASLAAAPRSSSEFWEAPRQIWMTRPASGELFRRVYWRDGQVIPDAYEELCHIMRDLKLPGLDASLSGVTQMSPRLLEIIYAYGGWLRYYGIDQPLALTSGYRHPRTNARLEGAALDSRHTTGDAADLIIPGVRSPAAGQFAIWLAGGGVGIYPIKGHVHVDSGPIRSWVSATRGRAKHQKN